MLSPECKFSCYLCSTTEGTQNSGWIKGGRRGRGSKGPRYSGEGGDG